MSVCVVAQYPWQAAQSFTTGQPNGVIVCSDTRVTSGNRSLAWICTKQLLLARNILSCYTSSNLYATSHALRQSFRTRDLRKVGRALKDTHKIYGGTTEFLAVVARAGRAPQVLELMSPHYAPKLRRGILGIGDSSVLDWFGANFDPQQGPPPAPVLPTKAIESLERLVGGPVEFPPVEFTIDDGALKVAAALSEGIAQSGGPTVGLPIQVMTVCEGIVRRLGVTTTADLISWSDITADPATVRFPRGTPPQTQQDTTHRTARQLFP